MSRVAIIGGGIGGLATAALLAREGHDVVLLERNETVGGRAGSWESDGFRFDTGPSWYLMPEVFDHFYRLMGTTAAEQLDLVQLDPGYRVYAEGHTEPLDVAADVEETLETFEALEPGSALKVAKYLDRAKEIYDLALARFLYTTFARLRPVFGGDVAAKGGRLGRLLLEPLDRLVNRTVRDSRLRQVLGYPAVFLGSAPALTPSMYSLMSHLDLVDGVYYPVGGFTTVIESVAALARDAGAELRTGVEVRRILVTKRAATGVEVLGPNGVEFIDADLVISGADLHHTETQLLDDPATRSYPEAYWRKAVAGPSALLVLLGIEGELPQLEHHTLFFAEAWAENFEAIFGSHPRVPGTPSFYVCKPSGVDASVAPEGTENVFVLVPLPADPGLGHGGVEGAGDAAIEALADEVIARMADWGGIPDLASRIVLRRTIGPADFVDTLHAWKGTALGPAHTLRQSAFFRPGNKSKRVDNLYYVGSSTIPGIGLPMCLISAELIVKRLRGDTSAGPLPEPLRATKAKTSEALA
ncbi:MAG: phytoene desaturase family protein [Pseudolysinimonas sp.]|uniref:phytoene desaturase family protein n=1 Tax=Pseudolysinimonas sp. TaxID=2680009 RepID=UPI003263F532